MLRKCGVRERGRPEGERRNVLWMRKKRTIGFRLKGQGRLPGGAVSVLL